MHQTPNVYSAEMALLLYAATAATLLWLARMWGGLQPANDGLKPVPHAISGWAAVVLILLPFCFTGHALLTGGVYGPIDLPYQTEPLLQMRVPLGVPEPHNGILSDVYAQMIPWRKALQYALAHRQWPLWNPFMLSGSLLAASAQPAVYSPFTLLACLLPIGGSLTYTAALTFFIAGLGAFLFAREIGCRSSAVLLAAAGWMYSTPIAFFVLWPQGASWALLPFVLLGARRCVRRPGVPSAALLMIALTLLLLAGHPETTLHVVFIGALYGASELARTRERVVAAIAAAFAAGVISLLLTAIYILPILEAAPQTMEYEFRMNVWSKWRHGVPMAQSLARMATDLFPFLSGQRWNIAGVRDVPLDSAAVGSIVLAFATYALLRARSRGAQRAPVNSGRTLSAPTEQRWKETWFFAAVALFGILARAAWMPLATGLQHLPLFAATITERFSFAAAFSLAILAAIGVEEFLRRGSDRVMTYVFAAMLVIITAGTIVIRSSGMVFIKNFPEWSWYAIFGEIGCLAIAALVLVMLPHLPLRVIAPALLIILLTQRWLDVGDIYPTLGRDVAYPRIPILEPLKNARGPFRIVGQAHAFVPGTSAMYGLEDVRGYEALTFARYRATYGLWCVHQPIWFNRVDDLTRPFLSFLNVRYAIASTSFPVPDGWHIVAEERGARLLENERALPRAFIPNRLVVGRAEAIDSTFADMQEAKDFRDCAWVDAPMSLHDRQNGPGTVSITLGRNGFRLNVTIDHDGWVIVSEPAWKGWRAYIDGRRVETQIANLAFIGIYVPTGRHTIGLVYLPQSFVIGRAISAITLMALTVFGFVRVRRRVA